MAVLDVASGGGLAIYEVHVDHLMRPILMTDQSQTWAWYARSLGCITADKTNASVMKDYHGIDDLLKKDNGGNKLKVSP